MTVIQKRFTPPSVNAAEILRYAGMPQCTADIAEILPALIDEAQAHIDMRVCYAVLPVTVTLTGVAVGAMHLPSKDVATLLANRKNAVVFAATLGVDFDRLLAKYSVTSLTRAALLQAIGAERVEALCDVFCGELQQTYGGVTPRFSAGYGDLPLECQRDFVQCLDTPRHIGVSLSESMLLTPAKSVTAVVGITDTPCAHKNTCATCQKTDCSMRRNP